MLEKGNGLFHAARTAVSLYRASFFKRHGNPRQPATIFIFHETRVFAFDDLENGEAFKKINDEKFVIPLLFSDRSNGMFAKNSFQPPSSALERPPTWSSLSFLASLDIAPSCLSTRLKTFDPKRRIIDITIQLFFVFYKSSKCIVAATYDRFNNQTKCLTC